MEPIAWIVLGVLIGGIAVAGLALFAIVNTIMNH